MIESVDSEFIGSFANHPINQLFGVGEIIDDEVCALVFERVCGVVSGCDGECSTVVVDGAGDIVYGVSDDDDGLGIEIDAFGLRIGVDCDGWEV